MPKRIAPGTAVTFVAASGQITAAAGTFAAFAVEDYLIVGGSNLNDGEFKIVATDASTFIQVDFPVKSEGPISTVEIRTQ
jgi:hypothetical protein